MINEQRPQPAGVPTEGELHNHIKGQQDIVGQYLEPAKFSENLSVLAQTLRISLKAALQVKQAPVEGQDMQASRSSSDSVAERCQKRYRSPYS